MSTPNALHKRKELHLYVVIAFVIYLIANPSLQYLPVYNHDHELFPDLSFLRVDQFWNSPYITVVSSIKFYSMSGGWFPIDVIPFPLQNSYYINPTKHNSAPSPDRLIIQLLLTWLLITFCIIQEDYSLGYIHFTPRCRSFLRTRPISHQQPAIAPTRMNHRRPLLRTICLKDHRFRTVSTVISFAET